MINNGSISLQYPVRPSFMTYDNVDIQSGKVKPDQKKVGNPVVLTHSIHIFIKPLCNYYRGQPPLKP